VIPLYIVSTPSDISETGLHILLDPFWVPNNLIEDHLTTVLHEILENLCKDTPHDTEGTDLLVTRFNGNYGAAIALARIVDVNGNISKFTRQIHKTCLTDAAVARVSMVGPAGCGD
jgi:hypothetical protein